MQYKVTKQYAKENEQLLSEFDHQTDALLFIQAKVLSDQSNGFTLIYRLFDHEKLLHQFNIEKINIPLARAQYAEGDISLFATLASPFSVLHEELNATNAIAKFCNIDDAKLFISAKLTPESRDVFIILNGKQFVERFSNERCTEQQSTAKNTQQKQQKQVFRPTPLAMTLRLGPSKWIRDEEDKKNIDSDQA